MSGLASNYDRAIRQELTAHAAWFPVTNTFKIGDFGYFEDGIFRAIGNIQDKYPEIGIKTAAGPVAKINFASAGTTTVKLDAKGNAVDSFASLGNAEATLRFSFSNANSCVIKANITSIELQNVEDVAVQLANMPDWRKKYKVVSAVFAGKNCVVVCSREAGTEFSIGARANILRSVEAGEVNGSLELNTSKDSVFQAVGDSGILALRLFQLNWLGNLKLLKEAKRTLSDITIERNFSENDF